MASKTTKEEQRIQIEYVLWLNVNKYFSIRYITMILWKDEENQEVTEKEVEEILNDIVQDNLDDPWITYKKDSRNTFACITHYKLET